MKLLEINPRFDEDHIQELINLEDWVPISFANYAVEDERDDFLKSKNLLTTMREMDELVRQKCNHCDDSVKAYNSVLIEWLDCHPEFEGMLSIESFVNYQNMAHNNDFIDFNDLLDIELPSEKKEWIPPTIEGLRDDSSIQLPNFKKIDEIFDRYGVSLVASYLAYLV